MERIDKVKRIDSKQVIKVKFLNIFWVLVVLLLAINIEAQEVVASENAYTQGEELNTTTAIDYFTDADFKVYPNPARQSVKIKTDVQLQEGTIITLCDMRGTLLVKRSFGSFVTQKDLTINLSNFSDGNYIVGIYASNGKFISKKVIKRS